MRCLFLLNRNFDLVENYDHRPAVLYPAILSKYLKKTPLISEWTDLHGSGGSLENRRKVVQKLIRPYEDFTEKQSKRLAEKLVVISIGLKRRAINLGIPESRIVYIPGGSDIENILPQQKNMARAKIGLPPDKKIVGYTAGTHYDKDLFLNTICKILKTRLDVLIVTTGAVLDHPLKRRLPDPERLIEYGFLPYEQYAQLLPAADVFIFPFANSSLNRGRWPNKIGDYMAAGRPTVSNRTGDLIDLFEKNHIGLLANDNAEDFAQKILGLLNDEPLMIALGKNARITAETQFDWEILARKLEGCFKKIVKGKEIKKKYAGKIKSSQWES